jgi:hypothetical protein
MPLTTWRKSSFSESSEGNCIEIHLDATGVAVRDSKNATGPTLAFERRGWRTFLSRDLSS